MRWTQSVGPVGFHCRPRPHPRLARHEKKRPFRVLLPLRTVPVLWPKTHRCWPGPFGHTPLGGEQHAGSLFLPAGSCWRAAAAPAAGRRLWRRVPPAFGTPHPAAAGELRSRAALTSAVVVPLPLWGFYPARPCCPLPAAAGACQGGEDSVGPAPSQRLARSCASPPLTPLLFPPPLPTFPPPFTLLRLPPSRPHPAAPPFFPFAGSSSATMAKPFSTTAPPSPMVLQPPPPPYPTAVGHPPRCLAKPVPRGSCGGV